MRLLLEIYKMEMPKPKAKTKPNLKLCRSLLVGFIEEKKEKKKITQPSPP